MILPKYMEHMYGNHQPAMIPKAPTGYGLYIQFLHECNIFDSPAGGFLGPGSTV